MGKLAAAVKENRATRDAARKAFDTRLTQVKQDLGARGIGGRIADTLEHEARNTLAEALEIANESKGIAAGTLTALALWFLRAPLFSWLQKLFTGTEHDEAEDLPAADGNAAPPEQAGEPGPTEGASLEDATNY